MAPSALMKVIACRCCADFVRPLSTGEPRICCCGRHVVWADRGPTGPQIVRVHDRKGTKDMAFALRLSNDLIDLPRESTAADIPVLLAEAHSPHLKQQGTLVAKAAVGNWPDLQWEDSLPPDTQLKFFKATFGSRKHT